MAQYHQLSRREFMRLASVTASATVLSACAPRTLTTIAPTATVVQPQPTSTTAPTATAAPTETAPPPQPTPKRQVKPIPPEMVLVEAGSFQMGSADGASDERPVHKVEITRSFYIAKYEVTFEEYDLFYSDTLGSGIKRPGDEGLGRGKRPVPVTWLDAIAYCNWLSEKEGLALCYTGKGRATKCDWTANGYRLPTEAEWEYAARGGKKSRGCKYAGSNNPGDVAWYEANSQDHSHPVGQKQPNELGLCDMSGNLWEWCWDYYRGDYYATSPSADPQGPTSPQDSSLERVKRGGYFTLDPSNLRATCRSAGSTTYWPGEGFRLVRKA
jgi:formylglycine-generating enzyme required for sulfatase activity